jgi:hypothetical protein
MRKRHTSKVRRRSRASNVLEVRILSPRIAWLEFLKFLAGLGKLACLLAVLGLAGWGVWEGIQRAFYQNPDFRLRVIDLNENPAVDAAMLVEVAGIDLDASLFDLDVEEIAAALEGLPQVASAQAERHLPDRLVVRVEAREARARIACEAAGFPAEPMRGTLLVDATGHAYLCPDIQLASAAELPVIHLESSEETPVGPGLRLRHTELQHAFRLLDAAAAADPGSLKWIESIEKYKEWALTLRTRDGTAATFGTGDHARQFANLCSALNHASREGYRIATINLIPRENVPITIFEMPAEFPEAPRAILVEEPTDEEIRADRRQRDLNTLLNRD